jgi:hypothetical protein
MNRRPDESNDVEGYRVAGVGTSNDLKIIRMDGCYVAGVVFSRRLIRSLGL